MQTPKTTPYYEQYLKLVDRIKREVHALKKRNKALERENERLRTQLEEVRKGQTDIFSAITERDRMALRHQIKGLISKIDEHLGEEEQA